MEARSVLASLVLAALAAQAFVGVVECRNVPADKAGNQQGDVKKPDCVQGIDPRSFPGIGGGHGGITPVPSHGGGYPSHGGSSGGGLPTPSHGGSGLPTPSHGGFGTSPSSGGAYGGSGTPATPSHGAYGGSSPSHGGGAYGGSPTPSYGDSPSSHGGLGDPHSPSALPGSCDYWRSHPTEIWSAIAGRFPTSSTMASIFGPPSGTMMGGISGPTPSSTISSIYGPNSSSTTMMGSMSIQDALANTRTDGAGALLREGAAALLNSLTRAGFPYTMPQVRDAFAAAAATGSDDIAASQAAAFKKANEGGRA